jgi:hypothetical protein
MSGGWDNHFGARQSSHLKTNGEHSILLNAMILMMMMMIKHDDDDDKACCTMQGLLLKQVMN